MATRKWHLFTAILVFLAYIIGYWYLQSYFMAQLPILAPLLILTAFLMALIGSEAPDWDFMMSWLQHRDITTHSVGIPAIITFVIFIQKVIMPMNPSLMLALIFIPFMFGFSSHLLLDLFPGVDPEKELKKGGITHTTALLLKGFISGLTGVETAKALQGTYLIHLPFKMKLQSEKGRKKWEIRKTLPLHASRWWLFFNGLLSLSLGIFILTAYLWR
ncbi:MAG: hypothetical protein EAX86_02125 [Candidatus Heimdallarchaeota archaeon]|nr:hypothetical protein [Candidatus Heimdallarchaeota archaeon]